MSITRVYWIIFILSHFWHTCSIGIYIYYIYIRYIIYIIYICIYIYKVNYIHSFFLIFNCNVFSALHAKNFEIWKNILWNWWVDCFIARSIKWCDILGAHSESIFPFIQCFISFQKTLIRVIDGWRDDDEFSWNIFFLLL